MNPQSAFLRGGEEICPERPTSEAKSEGQRLDRWNVLNHDFFTPGEAEAEDAIVIDAVEACLQPDGVTNGEHAKDGVDWAQFCAVVTMTVVSRTLC